MEQQQRCQPILEEWQSNKDEGKKEDTGYNSLQEKTHRNKTREQQQRCQPILEAWQSNKDEGKKEDRWYKSFKRSHIETRLGNNNDVNQY